MEEEKSFLEKYGVWFMAAAITLLVVIAALQFVQMKNLNTKITGAAVGVQSSGLSDYDKMMAEHHPDQVRNQGSNNLPQMVGGC